MNDAMGILLTNPMVSVIIAAFIIIFREVISAVKGLMRVSPADKIANSNEKLAATMDEVLMSLKLFNATMQNNAELSAMRHNQILSEIQAVRARVSREV